MSRFFSLCMVVLTLAGCSSSPELHDSLSARAITIVDENGNPVIRMEAKEGFDQAKRSLESGQRMILTNKKLLKRAQESLATQEKLTQWEAREAADAAAKLARLSSRRP